MGRGSGKQQASKPPPKKTKPPKNKLNLNKPTPSTAKAKRAVINKRVDGNRTAVPEPIDNIDHNIDDDIEQGPTDDEDIPMDIDKSDEVVEETDQEELGQYVYRMT
jgi:hypothetical protein